MSDPLPNLPTASSKDLDDIADYLRLDRRVVIDGSLETDQRYRERITAFFYSVPEKDQSE